MSLFNSSIASLTQRIRNGELTCSQLVTLSLERINDTNPQVAAFVSVLPERALARAGELDALPPEKKDALPLLGIPIAVKDNICTLDIPTTCGSRMLESFVPPYSATVVDALENAGAVIVGKANLDEFAMGSSTETSAHGPTHNPHDLSRIPGGSSGGSAAAVAAGCTSVALGSDTGGSIRQPCGHCGVSGLKPTYGRVSRYGLVAFASSLDQIGPIAADVQDLGTLLEVISVADPKDSTNARKPFLNDRALYSGDTKGMRIGIPREYFDEGLDSGVRACIDATVSKLSNAGAEVVDVSIPSLQHAIAAYYIICTAEASSNLARYDGVKYGLRSGDNSSLINMYEETRQAGFGAEVKRRIMLGTYVLSAGYYDAYYLKAARVRTLIAEDFAQALEKCDALASPVAPTTAFPLGEKNNDPLQMYLTDIYTVSANLAGIPAISVPCATHSKLPVGIQFMAPKWREDTLLRLGYAVQSFTGS